MVHVIPDEIAHSELLSPALEHRELLNYLRCQTAAFPQMTTVVLARFYIFGLLLLQLQVGYSFEINWRNIRKLLMKSALCTIASGYNQASP